MELDRTEIVIRQRSGLELLDLSMLVIKKHFAKLAIAGSVLGVPFLLIDVWLVGWMVSEEAIFSADNFFDGDRSTGYRYISHLIALYFVQFPLVSVPATMLLGSLVFYETVSLQRLIQMMAQVWFPVVMVLGLLRLGLVPMGLELLVDRSTTWHAATEIWILFVCVLCSAILRAFWPFAPEIIGLERCPLRRAGIHKISYRMRSSFLHGPIQGDMLVRFLSSGLHSVLLFAMLVGAALFVQGSITGSWQWSRAIYYGAVPVALWFVGMFMTVFRYLSYIDSRIRLEGWELELRMRAEATRILEQEEQRESDEEVLEGSLSS